MIVGTFRDTDVADGDPMSDLLAALHRVDTVERIALRGLDDTDLLELLERTAGHQMDDAGVGLRNAVLAETDGNPFFVNEILRHLAETGAIFQDDDGRWVGDLDIGTVGLPVSVTEVVGRRVATLGMTPTNSSPSRPSSDATSTSPPSPPLPASTSSTSSTAATPRSTPPSSSPPASSTATPSTTH